MFYRYKKNHLSRFLFGVLLLTLFLSSLIGKNDFANGKDLSSARAALASSEEEQKILFFPLISYEIWWDNPLGFEISHRLISREYPERTQELRPGWVRLNHRISWRELQLNQGGPIQWDKLDTFEAEMRFLQEEGVRPIIIVDDYPHWAVDRNARKDQQPSSCAPLKPEYYDDFAEFVGELVARYSQYEFSVHDWELGNEVDIDTDQVGIDSFYGCWGDKEDLEYFGGDHYGEMLKVVGKKIKQIDPQARVWIGGLLLNNPDTPEERNQGKPERFMHGVLAVGAAPYFDVLPYHAHTSFLNPEFWDGKMIDPFVDLDKITDPALRERYFDLQGSWAVWGGALLGKAEYLRQLMGQYGVEKPLFVNELGVGCIEDYSFCDPPIPEFADYQADMLVRVATRVIAEDDVEGFIWFTLNGPYWRQMGLMDGSEPRKSFYAFQRLGQEIFGAEYLGPRIYRDEIEAYTFSLGTKKLDILWAVEDRNVNIQVAKNKFIEARTRDGVLISATDLGNHYRLQVGFSPIYITFSH